ncbi:glycosyl hydrolase family 88 [Paenibacillus mucilaginosus 3016]|uniref:Glycosyl hydrolase family 88 n=2 Tax=Paenibacillus mucilaginosus TaxID=61624 RepID=H6NRC1_9BACL|nr:glycoside hydrolase family 88 protein [Paenibacillus mucilaginosus]AFC33556.1 glycosyl hydrolase family 88 [Paenibacillus mucilaginosus 3016]AFH65880.1 rhamnogalacturonyl hydrolase [Paenibacillus mucilaginosus K02]WFA21958.1 glycosyl hydrolase [Paenibacillus mucilaginosus]
MQWASAGERICSYMLEDHTGNWGLDLNQWDWVPGVGVIALLEYGRPEGREAVRSKLLQWVERNGSKAASARVINAMAPFAVYPDLYRETGEEALRDAVVRTADWMIGEAPRTREGAFEHTVTENVSFPEQVWADTVFMAVLFLARAARLTGSEAYAREAVHQVDLHLRLLQDEATGALFHGWNSGEGSHMSAARWTRANAWIAAAVPMIHKELAGLASLTDESLGRYRRLMRALAGYQRPGGLWTTVLDRPDFYEETSGSAGIACGMLLGIRAGLLEPELRTAADRALPAVLDRVAENGEVRGVSGGTPVMESVEAYGRIPCHPTLYGQGLALMLVAAEEEAEREQR